LTQIFVESCVDFEVAHLSVFMVWRLPYLEAPSLRQSWLQTGKQTNSHTAESDIATMNEFVP